eukprot:m.252862 g.252862  ORF g.252862 m.252862 type:complete len:427 (+) comp16158_c0_seq4:143-1423(+)
MAAIDTGRCQTRRNLNMAKKRNTDGSGQKDERYVPPESLERLLSYTRSDELGSALSAFTQPLLQSVVNATPQGVSPNLISLIALCVVMAGSGNVMLHGRVTDESLHNPSNETSHFKDSEKNLVLYIVYGISVLIHQFLNSVSRVLARQRPGTVPALNDLFRQATNTIACVFVFMGTLLSMQLGSSTMLWLGTMFGLVTWYMVQWQSYVTGKPVRIFSKLGVPELNTMLGVIPLATGIAGPQFWRIPLFTEWITINSVLFLFLVLQSFKTIARYWEIILSGGPGEMGTTPAGTACLSPLPPICFVLLIARQLLVSDSFDHMPCVALFGVGCIWAKITIKLYVAHLSRSAFSLSDVVFLPSLGILANTWTGAWYLLDHAIGFEFSESALIFGLAAFSGANLVTYVGSVLYEISIECDHSIMGVATVKN